MSIMQQSVRLASNTFESFIPASLFCRFANIRQNSIWNIHESSYWHWVFIKLTLTSYQGILQYHSLSNDITASIKYINTIYDMRLSVKFLLMYWITFSIFDAWLEQKQLQWAQYTRFSICQSKKIYSFFHFFIRICFFLALLFCSFFEKFRMRNHSILPDKLPLLFLVS